MSTKTKKTTKKAVGVKKQEACPSTMSSSMVHVGGVVAIVGGLFLLVGLVVYLGAINDAVDAIVASNVYILWGGVVMLGVGAAILVYGLMLKKKGV